MLSRPPPPPRSTLFPYTTLFRSDGIPLVREFLPQPSHAHGRQGFRGVAIVAGRLRDRHGNGASGRFGLSQSPGGVLDRKSTRLNSSHRTISYAVFCLKKKMEEQP